MRPGQTLDAAARRELLGILTRHPDASNAKVARLFFARTDIEISRIAVGRARKVGYGTDARSKAEGPRP